MNNYFGVHESLQQDEHSMLFIALENVFRSKGHDANKATELAYEAMNELESWYEEKMDEIDDD